jgi:hypothetical protein
MQEEADRQRDQGSDPVRKKAWAPVLADPGMSLDEDDDARRVLRLEALLERARATKREQKRWNGTMSNSLTKMGDQIDEQKREIERQGVTIGEQEREIERLKKENHRLRAAAFGKITTIVGKDLDPLCCPITRELFKDPVVTRDGLSFERHDIEKWLLKKGTCPITKNRMTIADLAPNYALANVADAVRACEAGQ